jgi:hypothetical protein
MSIRLLLPRAGRHHDGELVPQGAQQALATSALFWRDAAPRSGLIRIKTKRKMLNIKITLWKYVL